MEPSDTRERILDAAVAEAQEKGFRGATTRAIAARAGVNEVTLFRHFGSKAALARVAFERQMARLAPVAIPLPPSGETFGERLTNGALALIELLDRQRPLIHLAMREARANPVLRALSSQAPGRLRQRVAEWFSREQAGGAMRPIEPELAAQVFVGTLFTACVGLWAVGAELPFDRDHFVRGVVDVFIHGLAVKPGGNGERAGRD